MQLATNSPIWNIMETFLGCLMAQHDMERMLFKNKVHARGLQGMSAALQRSGSEMFTVALSSV